MRVITISSMILRVAFLLVLILGISFWAGWIAPSQGFKGIHMLLGIIVVLALWIIGLAQGRLKGGSFGLAILTFVVGLVVVIVGLWQDSWKTAANLELINITHLVLGFIAIGVAEMVASRSRRLAKANA